MNIETIKTRVQFEQILKDFAPVLYGQHNLPNLLCHEAIDKNFDQGFVPTMKLRLQPALLKIRICFSKMKKLFASPFTNVWKISG